MLPLEILHLSEDAEEADLREPNAIQMPDIGLHGLIGRSLAEIERQVIEATIEQNSGSVTKAARVLDVSPSTLYRKRESWARA